VHKICNIHRLNIKKKDILKSLSLVHAVLKKKKGKYPLVSFIIAATLYRQITIEES